MLRRRILASAMASVMAIGSVAVVASAEDTAAATKQMKTKADLEALVKSYDSFRAKEINDYGSKSGENFLDALEYAENVIDAAGSTVEDYTAAYQMVTATYNALKVYTAEELSTLVKANKAKYETNNIYNENIGDTIYKNEAGKNQWDKFVDAYEEADSVLTSKDSRVISDAYEGLKAAAENLTPMTTVTKAQYRQALKTYEELKQKVYTYDTWRRGTLPGWTDIKTGDYWKYAGANVSFGGIYSYFSGLEEGANGIYTCYDALDAEKNLSKTSLENYVNGYKNVSDAVDVLALWTADDTNRASKATVKSLIDKYRGVLVFDYCNEEAEALLQEIADVVDKADVTLKFVDDSKDLVQPWSIDAPSVDRLVRSRGDVGKNDDGEWIDPAHSVTVLKSASIDIYTTNTKASNSKETNNDFKGVSIPVDENGLWTGGAVVNGAAGVGYKFIARGSKIDITDFIDVTGKVTLATAHAVVSAKTTKTTAGDQITAQFAVIDAGLAKADADRKTKFASNADCLKAWNEFYAGLSKAYADYKTAFNANAAKITSAKTMKDIKAASAPIDEAWAALKPYVNTNGAKLAAYWEAIGTATAPSGKQWYEVDCDWNATKDAGLTDILDNDGKMQTEQLETFQANLTKEVNAKIKAIRNDADGITAARSRKTDNTATNEIADASGEYLNRWGAVNGSAISVDAGTVQSIPVLSVDLETAMAMAELYIAGDKEAIAAKTNPIYDLNTTDEIIDGGAKANTTEWTLVYRYLKYALSDKYDVTVGTNTKADVVALLEKSYDLAEKTGDAEIFKFHHSKLVDARKAASDWVAAANKDKKYKDGNSINGLTATDVYNDLSGAYTDLENDFNAFKYSFQEIYDNLAAYAEMIDEGELNATDELKTAMEQTALYLSTVADLDDDLTGTDSIDNAAFSSDRFFQGFNRVYTGSEYKLYDTASHYVKLAKEKETAAALSHYNLKTAYEALQAEVTKQTTPTTVLGDVNGDGVVNALDAAAILKAVVNNTAIDVAVGDYNNDHAVNALDAAAILKFVVSQA